MVRRRTAARKKRTAYAALPRAHALGGAPARRGGGWVIVVLGALVVVNLYVFVWDGKTGVRAIKEQAEARSAPALTVPAAPLAPAAAAVTPSAPSGSSALASSGSAAAPQARTIEGKVGKSDTLGRLLKHSGLSAPETDEIIRALSGALDFRTIRAGQSFRIERGSDGRVSRFELELAKSHHVRAERQPSGELRAITDTP